jgi:hypothetical protein
MYKDKNQVRETMQSVRLNKLEVAKLEVASLEAKLSKGNYIRKKLFGDEKK